HYRGRDNGHGFVLHRPQVVVHDCTRELDRADIGLQADLSTDHVRVRHGGVLRQPVAERTAEEGTVCVLHGSAFWREVRIPEERTYALMRVRHLAELYVQPV